MNQILCTEDYYVNRISKEKRRKRKHGQLNFVSSSWKEGIRRIERKTIASMAIVCSICLVFSYCIYAYGLISKNDETGQEDIALSSEALNIEPIEEPETIVTRELIGLENTVYTSDSGDKYTISAVLNIPSLGIEYPVLSKNSEELMKVSLNKYWGPEPNEVGNCCIVGHNYLNKTHFGKLPGIQLGDEIEITDSTGRMLTYIVYETKIIDPEDTSCTSQLTDGKTEITLITCANGGATRFIAKAVAIEK